MSPTGGGEGSCRGVAEGGRGAGALSEFRCEVVRFRVVEEAVAGAPQSSVALMEIIAA